MTTIEPEERELEEQIARDREHWNIPAPVVRADLAQSLQTADAADDDVEDEFPPAA
jgi:hypothetical protein